MSFSWSVSSVKSTILFPVSESSEASAAEEEKKKAGETKKVSEEEEEEVEFALNHGKLIIPTPYPNVALQPPVSHYSYFFTCYP